MSRVLIVDDEPAICWGLSRLALSMTFEAEVAPSAEKGLQLAAARRPDLLILDVRLPGIDGLSAMTSFRAIVGDAPIIVITAFGDLATAVRAVEQGAFEYVLKPFDLGEIRAAIERAMQACQPLPTPTIALDAEGMIGQTPTMQAVFKRIALAAASDASVLLTGESGVGKELAATAIHRHSAHREAPLVTVNVAALSPALADAELFGQAAGAFLGAGLACKGLLTQASGGTLFLDEVSDLSPSLQAKLLRVLEHGELTPLGADEPVKTEFRVIAASQHDLKQLVKSGDFRQDLYYRLCTFEILIPPLRERRDDIPLLARHFAHQFGDASAQLDQETLAELQRRDWQGNVRELRNAIEHALVVARRGAVLPTHLPPPLPPLQPATNEAGPGIRSDLTAAVTHLVNNLLSDPAMSGDVYERFLCEVEPPLLAAALHKCGRQCAPAARALGLHRTTLRRKLDQYGIDVPAEI